MATDDRIPMKALELFASNVKVVSKDIERLATTLNEINKQITTPPRHQELEEDHKDLDEKVTLVLKSLVGIEDAVKNGIKTIKIVAGVFGVSILIAISVTTYFNTKQKEMPKQNVMVKELVMEKRLDKLEAMWLKFLTEHIKKEGEKH
ncbi:hypothetical protein LCGC14_1252740 [marine sediment metagenome]|uniref:Uncharacterized protein n=1 Tax=marine sediment metagenome TaxID=412755 RepID=A0A0F9NJL4_9ZZZZ